MIEEIEEIIQFLFLYMIVLFNKLSTNINNEIHIKRVRVKSRRKMDNEERDNRERICGSHRNHRFKH